MSVVNQMLRDLDVRQASAQERAGLPARLRTLPPASTSQRQAWRTLVLGMGVGALVAGILVSVFMTPAAAPPSATPPPPVAAVLPAPTIVAPPSPPPPPPPIDLGEMKLSTLLSQGQVAPPAAKPASVARETKPAAQPAVPAAATNLAEAQIDKRSRSGQGRELAEAEYRKGMQAVKRGDNPAAQPFLLRALEYDPALAKARQALLSVLVGGKQWGDALRVAKSGLALDPAQSGWAVILARLQFEQGDTAAAVETLGHHAAYAGADADYQGLFAYLLQKQLRSAEAAERFKAALALRPNEGRWWFGLGLALENAGQGGEAKDAYARAREVGNLPADMASVIEQKLR